MSKKYLGIFTPENISFQNARKQSKVAEEIAEERGITEEEIGVPVSVTPESVIRYLEEKSVSSQSEQERRVFSQSAKWIEELFELKREVKQLKKEISKKGEEEVND